MATTNMRIVIRRDTYDNWFNNSDVVLLTGEQGYETDRGRMKIGDGISTWADLPYYVGGITDIDGDTIIMDAAGKIMLNSDSVIGNLNGAENVQAYVDAKDDALAAAITTEAATREAGDVALGARIDALTEASENGDTALAADLADSVAALVAADELETSERLNADGTLQVQISLVDAGAKDSVNTLDQKVEAYKGISDQGDISLGLYVDSVDAKFGSMTTPDGQEAATVTDFVGLVTGNLGGVNVKTYSDAGDSVLGEQISDLQDMDTTLGSQINDVNARIDALETNDHPTVSDIADSIAAGDDAVVAMLGDSVAALEDADALLDGRVEALETSTALQDSVDALEAADALAAPNDVGAGYNGVISNNGTVNAALLELETAVNSKYAENDNPSFGTVTASFIEGALKGDVWNDNGDTKVLENSTATLTGSVVGNVTGDVTGNLTGNVTGDVTGDLTGGIVGVVDPTLNADVSATASDVQDDIANAGTSVDDAIGELKTAVVELQDQLAALVASIKV